MSNSEPSTIVLHGSLHRRIIHKPEWKLANVPSVPSFFLKRGRSKISWTMCRISPARSTIS